MAKANAGKRFEQKFRQAMEPHAYVFRIHDNVFVKCGRIMSSETEADFLVADGDDAYLVECKATGLKSLKHSNVKEHQEKALLGFDSMGLSTHGFLAVEFYNTVGYRLPHRMFLLPIIEWMSYKAESGRKSMPISAFEEFGVELPYRNGNYVFDGRWSR